MPSREGRAAFVAATGVSQFEFLDALTSVPDIDWARTTMFHLDEYVGLSETHPASFRRYLKERLIARVHPGVVHLIEGDAPDPQEECRRLNRLIAGHEIDVSFVGIGENGHLAFNDPPADFEVEDGYIVVELDEACRRQQLGEGWFASL
jgi:glucosamine-6-phosphate deaminase